MQTTLTQSPCAKPVRWLELLADQVSTLRFGVVQITVHDARVVQLERIEKIRLAPDSADVSRKLIHWLEVVADQVSTLRFGVVQITVRDSHVVQLERIEKIRLAPDSAMSLES